MNDLVVKVGNIDDINSRWDYLIKTHPRDNSWIKYKEDSLSAYNAKTRLLYYGILDGKIICEATAIVSMDDESMQNKESLIGDSTAYLTAFRTDKDYENKGYFSKLYKFMENDLKSRGFKKLTLGVEPSETRNIMIYFKWGYTNYIKYAYEEYYSENENEESEKVIVNYYYKELDEKEQSL